MNNLIEIINLKKTFKLSNKDELLIIENLNLFISKNTTVSIVGPSGCGKSTLLNILGLLDSNFDGNYFFEDQSMKDIKSKKLSEIRNKKIGFVHQFFHLIPELTVLENIILPALVYGNKMSDVIFEVRKMLEMFEIIDKQNIKPNNLSGGEQQRVAIARALINKPELIIADEMTGNLDEKTSDEIVNFFLKFIEKNKISLVYATHNQKYAEIAKYKYELKDKNLVLK